MLETAKKINIRLKPSKLYYSPEWLVLGVNNICNLHCKMCDIGTKNQSTNFSVNLVGTDPLNMPLELFQRIVDQSKKYYPKVKLGYAFTEPLIYPHLSASLDYAKFHNIETAITTNALNLKQKAKEIAAAGVKDIYISLDGPEEIHNHIRGHKSSFQRAIAGIEAILQEPNPPAISVFCVITEWNIGHLNRFVEFFKKYPIKQIGFMHMNFTPQEIADKHNLIYGNSYPATDSNVDEINIDQLNLPEMHKEIVSIKKQTFPIPVSFSPELDSMDKIEEFYLHPDKLIGKRCSDIFSNMMIKSDGSVIPAHGRCYNLEVGNLYKQELNEIWNSNQFGSFRKSIMDAGGLFPACSRCCSAY